MSLFDSFKSLLGAVGLADNSKNSKQSRVNSRLNEINKKLNSGDLTISERQKLELQQSLEELRIESSRLSDERREIKAEIQELENKLSQSNLNASTRLNLEQNKMNAKNRLAENEQNKQSTQDLIADIQKQLADRQQQQNS